MASNLAENLKTICEQFGYNVRMLRTLIVIAVILSGCCTEQKSALQSSAIEAVEVVDLESDEYINEPIESEIEIPDAEEFVPRTIEEKWLDFKQRSKFSRSENVLYFAEELYDAFEPRDNQRKMELSFFISQVYREKGNKEKAKLYSQYFLNHLKSQQGGAAFKAHHTEKSAIKSMMDHINRKGMGLDE